MTTKTGSRKWISIDRQYNPAGKLSIVIEKNKNYHFVQLWDDDVLVREWYPLFLYITCFFEDKPSIKLGQDEYDALWLQYEDLLVFNPSNRRVIKGE